MALGLQRCKIENSVFYGLKTNAPSERTYIDFIKRVEDHNLLASLRLALLAPGASEEIQDKALNDAKREISVFKTGNRNTKREEFLLQLHSEPVFDSHKQILISDRLYTLARPENGWDKDDASSLLASLREALSLRI